MVTLSNRLAGLTPQQRLLLTQRLERQGLRPAPISAIPQRGEASAPFPLAVAQQFMWMLDRLWPGNPVCGTPLIFRFQGPFDQRALERTLTTIRRRHSILRTRFFTEAGGPMQQVRPAGPLPLRVVDLAHLPRAVRESAADG